MNSLSQLPDPGNTDLLSVVTLPFLEFHVNGTIQSIVFDYLHLAMFLKFTRVVVCINSLFLVRFPGSAITDLAFWAVRSLPPVPQLDQPPFSEDVTAFWLQSHSQDQPTRIHRQETTEKNPRTQGWGWSPPPSPPAPRTTETKTDHIRRVREVAPLPVAIPQASKRCLRRAPLGLQGHKGVKENRRWTSSFPSIAGLFPGPHSGLAWEQSLGDLRGLSSGGGGAYSSQAPSSYLQLHLSGDPSRASDGRSLSPGALVGSSA